jgi:hypothetical protein
MLHLSQYLPSPFTGVKSRVTFLIEKADASAGVANFPVEVSACFSWRKTMA